MFLQLSYKKKYEKQIFFASCKSMKKRVGSGSGSVSQSADPDPYHNVTDPQHCFYLLGLHTHEIFLTLDFFYTSSLTIAIFCSLRRTRRTSHLAAIPRTTFHVTRSTTWCDETPVVPLTHQRASSSTSGQIYLPSFQCCGSGMLFPDPGSEFFPS
jgi:hypothetical protein